MILVSAHHVSMSCYYFPGVFQRKEYAVQQSYVDRAAVSSVCLPHTHLHTHVVSINVIHGLVMIFASNFFPSFPDPVYNKTSFLTNVSK